MSYDTLKAWATTFSSLGNLQAAQVLELLSEYERLKDHEQKEGWRKKAAEFITSYPQRVMVLESEKRILELIAQDLINDGPLPTIKS